MDRLGFNLLTLGLAFVWLGWYYHAEWAIVPGLLLLAALTVLGLLRVDTTGYELDADARRSPMASLRSVFFFAFYAFAVAGALAAVAHTQAGGDGTMTAVTFVGLVLVLALYDYLPWEPLRASDTGRPVRSRGIDRPDGQRP